MLDWKQFFLAYLRSRSLLFVYLISLTFLLLLFQFLFASLGIYFLYFFLLCCFVTILFFTWDILVEMQVYRQELLYGEREAQSPLERALAEKLEARDMELYQQLSLIHILRCRRTYACKSLLSPDPRKKHNKTQQRC